MPRIKLPPTPASSLDIQAKDAESSSGAEGPFALPPPAMASQSCNTAASRPQPILPATSKPGFELPPPPTRSRRIIQMKPASQQQEQPVAAITHSIVRKGSNGKRSTSIAALATSPTGKKQPSATSAAGKKMARKTAHSVIERRRRSKMNEEFSVLKDMIPACRDQEMHKLAILSAGIEYLRYLERCVLDLKAANHSMVQPSPPGINLDQDEGDGVDEDQEMIDTPTSAIREALQPESPNCSAMSPPLTTSLASSSYPSSIATLPSPAFRPNHSYPGYSQSASTSPTILPGQAQDADHEATAALLMLNKDRRVGTISTSGRSMSVKDLLSPV